MIKLATCVAQRGVREADPTGTLRGGLALAALASKAQAALAADPASPHTLWYTTEAKRWLEALPIGNGQVGGMVFGGITKERIALTESTVWSGAPGEADVNQQRQRTL